jgi:hypothetical protein
MLHEGTGADLVILIRGAPRALVFISVPWSIHERNARQAFRSAVALLEQSQPELAITFFRLEVDEDAISQEWLSSVGFLRFATLGVGSLLWLQGGQVLSSETNANVLGVKGIVARSMSLWPSWPEQDVAADEPGS